ncbi:hypothetical protein BDN70DRAFT_573303 [Pholiota conissans]|uniref:F-box domain-containing protein n=1 Tax=Pholiota conissans TaxID=109636 RepID=A0A9P6D2T9_9AGAR|nr:hypothetical protein BDN70DRAFT_573303 [Pholiota conissans]
MSQPISIPPELFPIIASFIPLRYAPKTLLSLALVNHHFYWVARPLLYSRIVVGNEENTRMVLKKIINEPQLGMAITEIYIMTELSEDTLDGKHESYDVMGGLRYISVKKKLVPRLVALHIYLLDGWFEPFRNTNSSMLGKSYSPFRLSFWTTLRVVCPQLQSLSLRNMGYASFDLNSWLEGDVVDEIMSFSQLSTLRIECQSNGCGLQNEDMKRILGALPRFTTSLFTLSLNGKYESIKPVLSLHLPNLRWLRLCMFVPGDLPEVMGFFRRHEQLESLSLMYSSISFLYSGQWFSDNVEDQFLPNLKHLKATFDNILTLAPILPRLISLSFAESVNFQVPYLLRAVIPDGLPRLKSLEIESARCSFYSPEDIEFSESIIWHETADGHFVIHSDSGTFVPRSFCDDYIRSIVRGAPNLEELGLHRFALSSTDVVSSLSKLAVVFLHLLNSFSSN